MSVFLRYFLGSIRKTFRFHFFPHSHWVAMCHLQYLNKFLSVYLWGSGPMVLNYHFFSIVLVELLLLLLIILCNYIVSYFKRKLKGQEINMSLLRDFQSFKYFKPTFDLFHKDFSMNPQIKFFWSAIENKVPTHEKAAFYFLKHFMFFFLSFKIFLTVWLVHNRSLPQKKKVFRQEVEEFKQ